MASLLSSPFPLPNEILSLVADTLCLSDLYHCQLVCRAWHGVFRHAMYRSVDTDLAPSTLVRAHIPFQSVHHLQWHPPSSQKEDEEKQDASAKSSVTALLDKMRLLQSLHVPYPTVFRHLDAASQHFLHLRQLTLDDVPAFSVIVPLLPSLIRLRCLSLSCLSPLALESLDAIVCHAPELAKLALRSHILFCPNTPTLLSPNVHRKLTSLQIAFQWPAHGGDTDTLVGGGPAAPWLFYLSRTFPALQHMTLSGGGDDDGNSSSRHGGYGLSTSDHSNNPIGDDALFLACTALSRLPALTEVRLVHLNGFIHPDLYPLLVRHKQRVQLVGAATTNNDAWLARTLTSLQDHTTHLSMTMFYPRALCSSPLLQRLPLTSLSIGRTAGFCCSRDHWQLPLDDILAHAPHLVDLAFSQVTLSYHAKSVATTARHGLKRLRLQSIVLTNTVLEQCGRRCPDLHTLEMIRCKWMDTAQQAGRIIFPAYHRFQVIDIQDSGHLYNLHPYQLLTVRDQWILAPRHHQDHTRSAMTMAKQELMAGIGIFGEGRARQHGVQTWKQFSAWRRQPQWDHVDPEAQFAQDIACHGYLAIQCQSIEQLYFNGSSRISLLLPPPPSA